MWNGGSSPTINNCTFTDNNGYYGSGMFNISVSNPTLNNCVFSGNSADEGGGMFNHSASNPTLNNCAFSGNAVSYNGGGMCNSMTSNPTITNCIFIGNSVSYYGGGMANRLGSNPTIANCTFSGNSADTNGGGMYNYYYSSPIVTNCILWSNTAPLGAQIDNGEESFSDVTFSDVQDSWPGLGNIDADPCFVDADANDYHLKSEGWSWDIMRQRWTYDDVTSRCIDAGNPGSPLGDELLSVPDDPNNEWGQNLRINMGVFGGTAEASIPPYDWALLSDVTNDGISDFSDIDILSSLWLDSGEQLYADFNRDGIIDLYDFALLAQDWLEQTSWY
jgi:hypothetical protein